MIREADRRDLATIVALLRNDPLGVVREDHQAAEGAAYVAAFEAIAADPNHVLLVIEAEGQVVACLQLSFLPNLTYTGGLRAQIEGVRVAEGVRGRGLGRQLVAHAIGRARSRGCVMVQLTTDIRRPEALAFYQDLGFTASHHGMKLHLNA